MKRSFCQFLVLTTLILSFTGCQSAYYSTMEKVGIHKRDILVDRVEEGRNAQQEAKEQFQSALDKFTALAEFDGGNIQKTYDRLTKELKKSEDRASEVSDRIDAIEDVSEDLFKEWEKELKQYKNQKYRRISEQQFEQTYSLYQELIVAMKKAETSIQPVLTTFQDQVLFLKHNLNAQAITSLDSQTELLKSDIHMLINRMESSIAEADAFIKSMNKL